MKVLSASRNAVFAALVFCSAGNVLAEEDDLRSLPPAVQKTARALVGKLKVEEVEDTFEGGKRAYEVEFRRNDEKMAIVISETGKLIQTEHRLSPEDAPAQVKEAMKKKFPDGKISHFTKVEKVGGTVFEVTVNAGGKSHKLLLNEEGQPLSGH